MSYLPDHQPEISSLPVEFDAVTAEFDEFIYRQGLSNPTKYRVVARHFLIWLQISGIALETIDCAVIEQFLQHKCGCRAVAPSAIKFSPWRKCRSSSPLMWFIRHLECTGRVETPGDLEENLRFLSDFLERLREIGYSSESIRTYHSACSCLIVWLHLSRISLRELSPERLEPFWNRRIVCSLPGVFHGQAIRSTKRPYQSYVCKFLSHLAEIGRVAPMEPSLQQTATPAILARFDRWLEHYRNLGATTRCNHVKQIDRVLPVLGEDPDTYDADLIIQVFSSELEHRSQNQARALSISMRLYLRFLAAEGYVSSALVSAIPKVPQRRLSSLPHYISDDDVMRSIASCKDTPAGVRDRAILLLLARLALRAGDIISLCFDDIDWERAEIRVSGKSRWQSALPLPQDAGDAICRYITTARPRISEPQVFLTTRAPYRPLASSVSISNIAKSAFDRAGVSTRAGRGANVLRHSKATSMLRSGTSLNVIQALLRHESMNTTMIYAKTDVPMLQEVAQPWIGGGTEQ